MRRKAQPAEVTSRPPAERALVPPIDGLEHDELASAIASYMVTLLPGAVIAVQGSWGRGKTDVLRRVHALLEDQSELDGTPSPLWLNPWQYGSPNLIAPLVVELLERIKPEVRSADEKLRRAAQTLLRAGNAIAFKALSVVVPFGEVLQAGKEPVDELLDQVFDHNGEPAVYDVDPVDAMAKRFRELVEEYLAVTQHRGSLVICVDDLDRCLPDHQIAMLEAIHFLTGAGAQAYFLVALDPRLVQQAAVAHYGGSAFDTNQYLDKLFDLRINLQSLRGTSLTALLDLNLRQEIDTPAGRIQAEVLLTKCLGITGEQLRAICERTFSLPELTNPRFIDRVLRRLLLFARSGQELPTPTVDGLPPSRETVVETLIRLCTIAERWPFVRSFLQATAPEYWESNLGYATVYFGAEPPEWTSTQIETARENLKENPWLSGRFPDKRQHPDLGEFLHYTLGLPKVGSILYAVDQRLTRVGL